MELIDFEFGHKMILNHSVAAWFSHLLVYMGGCFGCCNKPTPIIAVDEPTKGLRIQGKIVRKNSISDDFWSTSACDLDNVTVPSHRSISSISASNPICGAGSLSNHSEFVNHGFLLWNESRIEWAGSERQRNPAQRSWKSRFSWNATYESLLGTRRPFPEPVPLSEMVDFLVDSWEHEGLYA